MIRVSQNTFTQSGVLRFPCCVSVYVGITKRSINTRNSEHKLSFLLGQLEISAVVENTFQEGRTNHTITIILSAISSLPLNTEYFPIFESRQWNSSPQLKDETFKMEECSNNFTSNGRYFPITKLIC